MNATSPVYEAWRRCNRGASRPSPEDREIFRAAYWSGALPKDSIYDLYQWVEDGFPPLRDV